MSGFLCTMVGATFGVAAAAEVIRLKKSVIAYGNAQIDTAQSKFGGSSLLLDGTDDRLEINPTTTYDDFTVECWIRLANNSGTKNILSFGNESTGRVFFAVYNDRIYWDQYGVTSRYGNTSMSANVWYHLAWSRTGSTIKLFVDGVEQTMTTLSGSGVFPSGAVGNTNGIFVGTLSDGAIDFNGHIDEIRVSNSVRYTTGFTPSTTPFVNDDNTVLLIHANGTDGSTFFEDDNGATPFSTRTAKTLTAQGNAQVDTAQYKFGSSALLCDGTGDYVLSPANSDYNFGTSSFTIEFWIRFNVAPTLYVPIALRPSGSILNGEWWCEITNAEKKMYWGFKNQAGTQYYVNLALAGTAFTTGVWYHIALVNNAGTAQMYVDGVATGTTTSLAGSFGNSTTDLWVGAGAGSYSLNGWIDEVRISKTARYTANFTPSTAPFNSDSNTVLLMHMEGTDASTTFTDDVFGVRTQKGIVASGNMQIDTSQSKFGGSSMQGDGTGDYLTTYGDIILTGDFTVEFWMRSGNSTFSPIGNTSTNVTPGAARWLTYYVPGSTRFETYWENQSAQISNTTVNINTWYHIAFVRSGSTIKQYIDGVAQTATITLSGTIGSSTYGSYYIGGLTNSNSLNGHMDEVRISNTARYTANFTPATELFVNDSNTLLLMHMDGTDASTVFRDDNGLIPTTYTSDVVAFDGSGDFYSTGSLSTTATDNAYALIAINFYYNAEIPWSGTNLMHLFNAYLPGGNGFYTWVNGGRMQIIAGHLNVYETAENSITGSAWNQVVFFIDSTNFNNCRIFVNGNSKALSNDGFSNANFNWGVTNAVIKIGQTNSNLQGAGIDFNGRISQVYCNNPTTFPGIEYFWDKSTNRPKDLGTTGTSTGLAQPLIYHYGGTSTFPTNNGTGFNSYTLTANGGVTTNAANTIYARARRQKSIQALGNAQIDTAQSKFGGSSALFDGTGDYLRVYDLPAISTGDFTVEFWFRPNYSSSPNMLLWDNRGSVSTSTGANLINFIGASPVVNYWVAGSYRITGTTVLSSGTWYHIAVSRSGTSTKLFINGTQDGSTYTDSNSYVSNPGQYIGQAYDGGASVNGHIDEFRVSNSARYTANFTAPTAPFQNDSNTLLLLHMDGTDASTVFFDDNGRDTTPT